MQWQADTFLLFNFVNEEDLEFCTNKTDVIPYICIEIIQHVNHFNIFRYKCRTEASPGLLHVCGDAVVQILGNVGCRKGTLSSTKTMD